MRVVFALAILAAAASPAAAQVVQDRYGPPSAYRTASLKETYRGPVLNWASKRAPQQAAAPEPAPSPAAPRPAPPPARYIPPRAALPESLYAPALGPQAAPLRPTPAPAAQPQQTAQAAQAAQALPAAGRPGTPPRFYSLHREYGMTPDAIPAQPSQPRYVLVGPPDEHAGKSDGGKAASSDDDGPST
jgi:hypothetical protein